jgi:hypothetical protein
MTRPGRLVNSQVAERLQPLHLRRIERPGTLEATDGVDEGRVLGREALVAPAGSAGNADEEIVWLTVKNRPTFPNGEWARYGCTARCAVLTVASATAAAGAMCER